MQRKGNDLNDLTTTASNEKQFLFYFSQKLKKTNQKHILAFETCRSSRLSRYMDVIYVTQSLPRRCSRSSLQSFKSRQRVVHTTLATCCVLSQLMCRLLKRMTFTF